MARPTDTVRNLLLIDEREAARDSDTCAAATHFSRLHVTNEPLADAGSNRDFVEESIGLAVEIKQLLDRVSTDCPHRRQLATIAERYQSLHEQLRAKIFGHAADDTFGAVMPTDKNQSEDALKFVGHLFVRFAEVSATPENSLRLDLASEEAICSARTSAEQAITTIGKSHLVVEKNGAVRHVGGPFSYQDVQQVADMLATKTGGNVRMFVTPALPDRSEQPNIKLA